MKTQSIYYKDAYNPTTDELYAVTLDNLQYIGLICWNTIYSLCGFPGDCLGCPFSHDSISVCYLDSEAHMAPVFDLLQQSHPELFL